MIMRIRIKFFSLYSDVVRERVYEADKPICISTLMGKLIKDYPALKKLFEEAEPIILVNGTRVDHGY
jgi:molybdopterin converting factor small subunit